MMHNSIKCGYKRLSGSEDIIWTKSGHMNNTDRWTQWFKYTPQLHYGGVGGGRGYNYTMKYENPIIISRPAKSFNITRVVTHPSPAPSTGCKV